MDAPNSYMGSEPIEAAVAVIDQTQASSAPSIRDEILEDLIE